MKPETTRRFVLLLVALVVAPASLLAPARASAEKRLFRVHRSFYGAPFPPARVHTHTAMSMWNHTFMGMTYPLYGGAGRVENFVEPFRSTTPMRATRTMTPLGAMGYWIGLRSTASVSPMNPVGGMITLPRSFIDYHTELMYYSSTGFTGYTSFSYVTYVNGRARFRKNNPYGATMTARVVFPTTQGNPAPNQGSLGSPVTPTTTFGGDFSFSRAGSFNITPGPNRFGGTMRILYDNANSKFSQYIGYYGPTSFFRAYGTFNCLYKGVTCTQDLETRIKKIMTPPAMASANLRAGQITSTGMVSRFLLAQKTYPLTKKTHFGMSPGKTPGGVYRKIGNPPAVSKNYYMHLIAPWTTGKVRAYNIDGTTTPNLKHVGPQIQGYDKVFATPGGMNLTVTVTRTDNVYQGQMVNYYYATSKQKVPGVTRAVSLVRPRLIHTFERPRIPTDPPTRNFTAARLWKMNVYFVPEPGALLMLGSALAGLAGLYLLRRRSL